MSSSKTPAEGNGDRSKRSCVEERLDPLMEGSHRSPTGNMTRTDFIAKLQRLLQLERVMTGKLLLLLQDVDKKGEITSQSDFTRDVTFTNLVKVPSRVDGLKRTELKFLMISLIKVTPTASSEDKHPFWMIQRIEILDWKADGFDDEARCLWACDLHLTVTRQRPYGQNTIFSDIWKPLDDLDAVDQNSFIRIEDGDVIDVKLVDNTREGEQPMHHPVSEDMTSKSSVFPITVMLP